MYRRCLGQLQANGSAITMPITFASAIDRRFTHKQGDKKCVCMWVCVRLCICAHLQWPLADALYGFTNIIKSPIKSEQKKETNGNWQKQKTQSKWAIGPMIKFNIKSGNSIRFACLFVCLCGRFMIRNRYLKNCCWTRKKMNWAWLYAISRLKSGQKSR